MLPSAQRILPPDVTIVSLHCTPFSIKSPRAIAVFITMTVVNVSETKRNERHSKDAIKNCNALSSLCAGICLLGCRPVSPGAIIFHCGWRNDGQKRNRGRYLFFSDCLRCSSGIVNCLCLYHMTSLSICLPWI